VGCRLTSRKPHANLLTRNFLNRYRENKPPPQPPRPSLESEDSEMRLLRRNSAAQKSNVTRRGLTLVEKLQDDPDSIDYFMPPKPQRTPNSSHRDRNSKPNGKEVIESYLGQKSKDESAHDRRSTRAAARARPEAQPTTAFPERYSIKHGLGDPWEHPLSYPFEGRKKAVVEFDDLSRLDEGEFLNDNLIQFYLRWLQENKPVKENQAYTFSTHFYSVLTSSKRGINYSAVERWTRNDDIFAYDYVLVPINESAHWYLAIICNLPNVNRVMEGDNSENLIEVKDDSPFIPKQDESVMETKNEDDKAEISDRSDRSLNEKISNMALGNPAKSPGTTPPSGQQEQGLPSQSIFQSSQGIFSQAAGSPTISRNRPKRRVSHIRKYGPNEPIVVILDSLGASHSATISNLKEYIIAEGKAKRGMEIKKDELKGANLKHGIPQQDNFCDCGLYLLGYVEQFMKAPKQFGRKLLAQEFDLELDWPEMSPTKMRNGIRETLQFEAMAQNEKQKEERLKKKAEKAAKRAAMVVGSPPLNDQSPQPSDDNGDDPAESVNREAASPSSPSSLSNPPLSAQHNPLVEAREEIPDSMEPVPSVESEKTSTVVIDGIEQPPPAIKPKVSPISSPPPSVPEETRLTAAFKVEAFLDRKSSASPAPRTEHSRNLSASTSTSGRLLGKPDDDGPLIQKSDHSLQYVSPQASKQPSPPSREFENAVNTEESGFQEKRRSMARSKARVVYQTGRAGESPALPIALDD
jgi:sentrin-specific protease 7